MISPPAFGVYVHWPYCARICPYCDFNVRRARPWTDTAALIDAIAADLAAHRAALGPREAQTVFLGGGTPSLLSGGDLARLLAAIDRAFPLSAGAEITLEANPEDRARYADHVAAGANRLSLGVQALRDGALKALFRLHDAKAAVAAVEAAAATGARVSLDLIYARPGQSLSDWRGELTEGLALPAEHLSLYQLTIEAGTAFDRAAKRGALRVPPPDLAADFYEATQEIAAAAGAPAYEISNHARGRAARARHNELYWSYGEWVGVGPGAHGRVLIAGERWATQAHRAPEAYIAASPSAPRWAHTERLTPDAQGQEMLALGLRLDEGLDEARYAQIAERALPEPTVQTLAADGLLTRAAGRIALTPAGRLVANRIVAELALSSTSPA